MGKGGWRVIIWLAVIAVIIVGQLLWSMLGDAKPSPSPQPQPALVPASHAETAQWLQPIAALGSQQLAKKLITRPLRGQPPALGQLLWWHDGQAERIAYLPAAGEDPQRALLSLLAALEDGSVVMYNLHGDEQLLPRILDSIARSPVFELPVGWRILLPPNSA